MTWAGGGSCFECGSPADVDHHVVPRSRGGKMTVPLCLSCHGKAHDLVMTSSALIRSAMDRKREKSERISGRIPYGFRLAVDGKSLVVDEAEKEVVDTILAMRARGFKLRQIVSTLNLRGVPTKGGKPWCVSTVHTLIRRAEVKE